MDHPCKFAACYVHGIVLDLVEKVASQRTFHKWETPLYNIVNA